ncbi:response regulator [Halopseudomonas salegens]|uniref:Response regulator receiver domain-containing protein n=1 Tax=Halopseudomonas salegens TaxID=1434072 RepID=A0A1H2H2T5_9GAMM|nr:response regulator [Halopseudomonas salegens]SDU26136.1 Response regulator receiver domain-containing protein [Halopseudomonas salegens]
MTQPIRIMFVDDEERILRSLALQFRRHYQVLTESNPLRALQRLQQEPVDIIVSDQRMPQMSGSQLLAQVQERYPQTLRILLTGYSDLDAAVDALNSGGIFRYLTKPWDPQAMAGTLRQAAQLVHEQRSLGVPTRPQVPANAVRQPSLLLLDPDPDTVRHTSELCRNCGILMHQAHSLNEALDLLNDQPLDILVSDIRLRNEDMRPLLMSLAQAHPRMLSIIITPFQDTQVLLKLINQAQIFRYLPKPIRSGMYERAIRTAADKARHWQNQPQHRVQRAAEIPDLAAEQSLVGNLLGRLGRLRQRLIA